MELYKANESDLYSGTFTSILFRSIALEVKRALTVISSLFVLAIAVTWIDIRIITFIDIVAAIRDVWVALVTFRTVAVMPTMTLLRTKHGVVVLTIAVVTAAGRRRPIAMTCRAADPPA